MANCPHPKGYLTLKAFPDPADTFLLCDCQVCGGRVQVERLITITHAGDWLDQYGFGGQAPPGGPTTAHTDTQKE